MATTRWGLTRCPTTTRFGDRWLARLCTHQQPVPGETLDLFLTEEAAEAELRGLDPRHLLEPCRPGAKVETTEEGHHAGGGAFRVLESDEIEKLIAKGPGDVPRHRLARRLERYA
jgi:hypothetical protein